MSTAPRFVASGAILCLAGFVLAQSPAPGPTLPEGPGRDIAQANCVSCHDVSRLLAPGHNREGWQDVLGRMMKVGVQLDSEQAPILADYLARSFPPQPQAAANLIAGDVHVSFREWAVATPAAFPHDPLATADGAIWYTGQHASVLGRIDPESGAITEYKMPDPTARDPHTPVFDTRGVLWITVQGANMIGRIEPRSGEVKLVTVPTMHALPYGIAINSRGVPFFAEFGANRITDIDPQTMTIHEYVLPHAGTRPRRIAITSDDVIWYSDYARGYLGRYDPKSGVAQEWASPGGTTAQPYGITALNDIIWYSESGVRPNTLVRFDPESQKFQSWPIPSGGGVVRNMMPTKSGGLVLAESGAGKVALVTIE